MLIESGVVAVGAGVGVAVGTAVGCTFGVALTAVGTGVAAGVCVDVELLVLEFELDVLLEDELLELV